MKDYKIYSFITVIFLIVYLVAQFNKPQPLNWSKTYLKSDNIPYGTSLLYNNLQDIFPKASVIVLREPVYNAAEKFNMHQSTFIILCNAVNLNEYDYLKLVQFIKNGNDVFIAASKFGGYFKQKLKIETQTEFVEQNDKPIQLSFVNKKLNPRQKYSVGKNICYTYFSKIDTEHAIILGVNSLHHLNYLRINMGQGTLFLNSNPLLFTNYSLINQKGRDYAAFALSYLKNNKILIWDEYFTKGRVGNNSYMRVLLRYPSLKAAYYIALFSLLLFVVYQIKRRQRIIPIIEPLQNTSVEFVKVVGQVYYEQRNNSNIAQKKVTYFLDFLRVRFNLKNIIFDDDFMRILSQKSSVEYDLIVKLSKQILKVQSGVKISDKELISFNQNIEQFYTQSS